MKRKWHHPEAAAVPGDRVYWRSTGELDDTPEFREWLEREFPRGAAELGEAEDKDSRRNFLKLMGASASLAGLGMAGCRRPEELLVPFNKHVEWLIPGKALYYSSAIPLGDGCMPLVVTTHEGRPTRVDGNRLHPNFGGGTDHFIQASVLDLYDPDRSKNYVHVGENGPQRVLARDFETAFTSEFRKGKGEKTAILVGASSSPTRSRVLRDLRKKYPDVRVFEYEPFLPVNKRKADKALWGEGVASVPNFRAAKRIVSLDADFLGLDRMGEDPAFEWVKGRDPKGEMSRLYAVEPSFTITGGSADHRLRVPASQVLKVAAILGEKLGEATGNAELTSAAKKLTSQFETKIFNLKWIEEAAKDLAGAKGQGLVVAGSRQPVEVHLLAGLMNVALGSVGEKEATVRLYRAGREELPGLAELAGAIENGDVETLISLTPADPVYDAPADLDFGGKMAKLKQSVQVGVRYNHTAKASKWHVPGAHYLESWSDLRSLSGVVSVVQPMILPLYDGVSELDFLLNLIEAPKEEESTAPVMPGQKVEPKSPAYQAVRATFKELAGGDAEKAWNLTLRDGFLKDSQYENAGGASADAGSAAGMLGEAEILPHPHEGHYDVVLTPSSHVWDGRFINNAWLQEVPDPISKLTWDNAALISFRTAKKLGVKRDGQMLEIKVGDTKVEAPALRMPGQAEYTVTLALGYGQDKDVAGRVGAGSGFDAYPLTSVGGPFLVSGAAVRDTGAKYKLALTSEHWSMEGRAIVRENTYQAYQDLVVHGDEHKKEKFAQLQGMDSHIPENVSLYQGPDYFQSQENQPEGPIQGNFEVDQNHQWGMTIDLNSCIGCNACTVACQSENNIPIVGKEQVLWGREMHWIRMDRYFSSPREQLNPDDGRFKQGRPVMDDDRVEMLTQPVACMQCEAAPCETVCPVNATVHTDDGLNAMTYNRCIGTRYCANNCPYKARRFNYFDFNKRPLDKLYLGPLAPKDGLATTSHQLQKNPNVTVRMRGVIEKCTYCVQRIQDAKIKAKVNARDSKDVQVPANTVTSACQDACPTEAIVFGNLRNPKDNIHKTKDDPRNYELLKYLNVRPRTTYLAKVRNPNPSIPNQEFVGAATIDMH